MKHSISGSYVGQSSNRRGSRDYSEENNHSAISSSPTAPPRITGYFSNVLSAATAALEPSRHFAVARLEQGIVPVACAFAGRGARGSHLFVVSADGLFLEFVLDTQRGGDMIKNREYSTLLKSSLAT